MASTTATTTTTESSALQVQIKLFTRHPDISVSSAPLLVPTSLRRYGLSQIVNHLLETQKPIPFDFLIDGVFLRKSLDEYLTENGLSSESTLTLEYVRASLPPVHLASFEHDDWVSSVATVSSCLEGKRNDDFLAPGQSRVLSGSYDGIARIWNMSGHVLCEASGHSSAIKSVGWIAQNRFLTASMDRTVRLWGYEEPEESVTGKVTSLAEFIGHKGAVNSIAISPSGSQFLTSSQDGTIKLWATNLSKSPPAPAIPQSTSRQAKKRKVASSNIKQLGPLSTLTQPTNSASSIHQPVSASIYHPHDPQFAYSTTWSHTILTHDLLTSQVIDSRTTSHPLLSIASLPNLNLLACGSSARHITLHDPRADAANISQATLRGHTNAVVALSPSPSSDFLLVSASHDGLCRVWDVRASGGGQGSLYTIKRQSAAEEGCGGGGVGGIKKVFGVEWSSGVGIVSAGEDKRVQVNSGVNVAGEGGEVETVIGGKS